MPKRAYIVTPSPRRVRSRYSMARRSRAASKIQRAWRAKRRARSSIAVRRRHIGQSIRWGLCKSAITTEVGVPVLASTNTLYFFDVTDINVGQLANQRERGIINCRGFKWFINFWNKQGVTPMFVNCALVAKKALTTNNPVEAANFFRANAANRTTTFAPLGDTPFQQHIRSINPDDYTVLWHKRFTLAPNNSASSAGNSGFMSAHKMLQGYTKLNRAIAYDEPESNNATDGQCALVYWFGRMGGVDLASVAEVEVNHKVIMYFKEPKQG